MANKQAPPGKKNFVRRFFSILGPDLITGAADDDPSGVATYSIAGAQLGTAMLWTAFITWPLMGCVQFMCARGSGWLRVKVSPEHCARNFRNRCSSSHP
jgi:Mn2+/Fe2+ NRAMP family transporter